MSLDLLRRSDALEIMDDLNCSGAVVYRTLVELEIINKWLGGNAVTIQGLHMLLKNSSQQSISSLAIADLGCGGGDMLKRVANEFKKKKLAATFTGIDANVNIIEYAQKNSEAYPEIQYKALDIFSEEFSAEYYDIVFATLFFHHFSNNRLVEVFKRLKKQVKVGIVVNDLHRHWLAYYSIKILTKFFSKSSMVKYDAPLSVLRGFRKKELIEILQKAGIETYSLKWKWAFRWQVIIYC